MRYMRDSLKRGAFLALLTVVAAAAQQRRSTAKLKNMHVTATPVISSISMAKAQLEVYLLKWKMPWL